MEKSRSSPVPRHRDTSFKSEGHDTSTTPFNSPAFQGSYIRNAAGRPIAYDCYPAAQWHPVTMTTPSDFCRINGKNCDLKPVLNKETLRLFAAEGMPNTSAFSDETSSCPAHSDSSTLGSDDMSFRNLPIPQPGHIAPKLDPLHRSLSAPDLTHIKPTYSPTSDANTGNHRKPLNFPANEDKKPNLTPKIRPVRVIRFEDAQTHGPSLEEFAAQSRLQSLEDVRCPFCRFGTNFIKAMTDQQALQSLLYHGCAMHINILYSPMRPGGGTAGLPVFNPRVTTTAMEEGKVTHQLTEFAHVHGGDKECGSPTSGLDVYKDRPDLRARHVLAYENEKEHLQDQHCHAETSKKGEIGRMMGGKDHCYGRFILRLLVLLLLLELLYRTGFLPVGYLDRVKGASIAGREVDGAEMEQYGESLFALLKRGHCVFPQLDPAAPDF
ncbi:MAG: hypothetical protein L6R40_003816 [Gallowayella cf. fulva]|nr:MAG: hypothetical protein L6R40_003816 [Xanthomendoza cf. fulva]